MALPPWAPGASKKANRGDDRQRWVHVRTKITWMLRSSKVHAIPRQPPINPPPLPAGALPALQPEDKLAEKRPPRPMCVIIHEGRCYVTDWSRMRLSRIFSELLQSSLIVQFENQGNLNVENVSFVCFLMIAGRVVMQGALHRDGKSIHILHTSAQSTDTCVKSCSGKSKSTNLTL